MINNTDNPLLAWQISLLIITMLYCFLHSLLAASRTKKLVNNNIPAFSNYYRLIYNLISVIGLIPIITILYLFPGPTVWSWPYGLLMDGIALAAVIGIVYTSKYYDKDEFLGTKDLRNEQKTEKNGFVISPLHRVVRHPWYFFALIILWSRDITESYLIICTVFSIYFYVGSRFEEKKLVEEYGMQYRLYQQKVPALIPNPFKHLSNSDIKNIKSIK